MTKNQEGKQLTENNPNNWIQLTQAMHLVAKNFKEIINIFKNLKQFLILMSDCICTSIREINEPKGNSKLKKKILQNLYDKFTGRYFKTVEEWDRKLKNRTIVITQFNI